MVAIDRTMTNNPAEQLVDLVVSAVGETTADTATRDSWLVAVGDFSSALLKLTTDIAAVRIRMRLEQARFRSFGSQGVSQVDRRSTLWRVEQTIVETVGVVERFIKLLRDDQLSESASNESLEHIRSMTIVLQTNLSELVSAAF